MKSRTNPLVAALALFLLLASGCAGSGSVEEPSPEFRTTASIRDIMFALVDPSADEIWDSVATIVDIDGVHEEFPETDEEWEGVEAAAIRLLEGTNLLLIPGRRVADPDDVVETSPIELRPEQIEELIDQDRGRWVELVHGLHDAAAVSLAAVAARDTEALLFSGEDLDAACERCHLVYWYPDDEAAREAFEASEQIRLEGLSDEQE